MTKRRIMPIVGSGLAFVLMCGLTWQMLPKTNAALGEKSNTSEFSTQIAVTEEASTLQLNSAKINVKTEAGQSLRQAVAAFSGKRLHLVKFNGPIKPEWHQALIEDGLEIVDYIPSYAYLVYGDSDSLQKMQTRASAVNSSIEWDAPYLEDYRIQPGVYAAGEKGAKLNQLATNSFIVQLHKDDDANAETVNLINSFKKQEIANQWQVLKYVNFVVSLDENSLRQIAQRPDVISIAPWIEPTKNDERQDIIMSGNLTGNVPTPSNYLSYLSGKGFTQAQFDASGFVVNLSDDGLDSGASNTAGVPNPLTQFLLAKQGNPSNSSRIAYIRPYGSATLADSAGCDGHGNLNTSIVGGYVPDGAPFNAFPHADTSGFRYGLGVAPFVKVGNSTIFKIGGSYSSPNIPNLEAEAYRDGSRISSNSWGASTGGAYNADSQTYDVIVRDAQGASSSVPVAGNQEYTVVFAAGNAGSGASTVGSPGTAKNVITAGASENVQAFGGADGCGVTDAQADSANDIIGFSSRGPTTDGRKKPEIVAPGTHVSGAVAQNTAATNPVTGNGTQRACFNGSGVCGGVGGNLFFPAGQQWYTASSGTSHSTPAIAGAAALVRQYFINQSLSEPSPAMTKAILMNSAAYLTGTGANDNRWSNNQGMGLLNLNNFFDIFARARVLKDEGAAELFTATSQTRTYVGTIVNTGKPLNVTLAWTEPPGSTTAASPTNNLDLEVTAGGQTYKGNVFTGAYSSTGGTADNKNNVESVLIPAGVTGSVVVKVTATNIAGDGVPQNASALDQDFALVASNLSETPAAVINGTVAYVSDNGTPVNNVPDPGETVTVNLTLQNVGTASTGNVTATLLNTGGITNPSSAQSYGTLAVGSMPVSHNFSFQVPAGATCGSTITLTFAVNDGTTTTNVTKTYTLGTLQTSLSENFDGVTAPALPTGWTVTTASGNPWVTTTTTPDTAPNAAFTDNPGAISDKSLVSPAIAISSSSAQLTFRNKYNTENTYDGMVLEVSTDGGTTFTDIVTAGGAFVAGGYNGTISSGFMNPIGGRMAWTGNSTTYIDTAVNLPASFNGQSVKFRWRMASDTSVAGTGVYIDTIKVFGSYQCATVGGNTNHTRFDFDGDGKADQSVFRPSKGTWYLNRSNSGFLGIQFGASGDIPAAADFDGDGRADIAVFRPSNGTWYRINSGNNSISITQFGVSGDAPVPGDFDGDGKADIAVFRPSNGTWYRINSGNNTVLTTQFGQSGDVPVVGDFDGDNKTDLAVFRPSNGTWYRINSNGGGFVSTLFGASGDVPTAADYDGDNKADIAVFRPSNGTWYRINSNGGAVVITQFGQSGDVPTAADYDGDNKADLAVFRPSNGTWYRVNSNGGAFNAVQFGVNGDIAVPSTY